MKLGLPLLVLALTACARGPIAGGPPVATRPPRTPPAQSAVMQSASEPRLRLPEQASAHALLAEAEVAEPAYDMAFSEEDIERDNNEVVVDVAPGPLPLYGAIMLQKVDNYETWRAGFDDRLEARKRAGFVAQGIMRGVDDPKLVAVWLAVTDLPLARAYFAARPAVSRKQRGASVAKPRVQLSSNVVAHMEPGRKGLQAAIIVLRVKELAVFKAAFDAEAAVRHEAGVIGYALSQDVDDEHLAYLYIQSEQATALKAYVGSRETKTAWHDAGVESVAGVTFVREDELSLCR